MEAVLDRSRGGADRAHVDISALESPAALLGLDEIEAAAQSLAERLARTAVARDAAGGHAAAERELVRGSGLLAISVPREHGGPGIAWPVVCRVVRRIAEADSALAHLVGFHHLQLAGLRLYGSQAQQSELYTLTLAGQLFWGNALNPADQRTRATRVEGGWRLDGCKGFSSGAIGSDWLTVSAIDTATQAPLIAVLPTDSAGVATQPDWDAFGQRQTDSGTVQFDAVHVDDGHVLQQPGTTPTPQATLRSQLAQLIMTNLYLGLAIGAFGEARRYLREEVRPWSASGQPRAVDDPFLQQRTAELWLHIKPASLLADAAAEALQTAWNEGPALSADGRGAVAIAVAEAKVLAHRAALAVGTQMFDLTGARSTSARLGFDRFWRNARVHTLHDPLDYKLRDIGRHLLDDRWPEPTPYS